MVTKHTRGDHGHELCLLFGMTYTPKGNILT